MTDALNLVAPHSVPGESDDAGQGASASPWPATFSDRNHFPAPRGRVVATRPPDGAPTLADVIADYMADYMAEAWEEGT